MDGGVGLLEVGGLLVEARGAGLGDVVGASSRARLGGLPLRPHQALPFHGTQRAVDAAGVTVPGVQRTQPGHQLVPVVRLLAQEQ